MLFLLNLTSLESSSVFSVTAGFEAIRARYFTARWLCFVLSVDVVSCCFMSCLVFFLCPERWAKQSAPCGIIKLS